MLLRNPDDAVLTRASRVGHKMMGALFERWIKFFCAIESNLESVIVASFESVTKNPSDIVCRLNEVYGLNLNIEFPAGNDVMNVLKLNDGNGVEPVIPNESRERIKQQIKSAVLRHLSRDKAREFYARLGKLAI